MQLGKIIIGYGGVLAMVLCGGCSNIVSSAVESGIVYVVAKHDETVEKKQKRYTATDRCVIGGYPEAFAIGDAIAYGQPLTAQYDKILSRTGEEIPPVEPMHLAYAFYIIADSLNDNRGKARMLWLENQMLPGETLEIQSIINDKFLNSHLEKCFTVPAEYKIAKSSWQMIQEEQVELERMNKAVMDRK